jgi:hypothetical protein
MNYFSFPQYFLYGDFYYDRWKQGHINLFQTPVVPCAFGSSQNCRPSFLGKIATKLNSKGHG